MLTTSALAVFFSELQVRGFRVVDRRQTLDLLNVEHRVALHVVNLTLGIIAAIILFSADDGVGVRLAPCAGSKGVACGTAPH